MKIGEWLQINEKHEYYSWENHRTEIYHDYFEFFTYPFIIAFGSRNYENKEFNLRILWFRAFYNNKRQNGNWTFKWKKWY